ncbi:MAG: tRNA lysidine(34) synthetase TilS [Roseovarius sp.]
MSAAPGGPAAQLAAFFAPDPAARLGVAVSGGSDSLALLTLLKDWRDAGGPELEAVTVDHGLRPEAACEAAEVARLCARWQIPQQTLRWQGWDGTGNLADRARRARYALIAEWATARGLPAVALGHTADDQAETFLMRLSREAGLDGLSAMRPEWHHAGTRFLRPLLGTTRDELKALLTARGLPWANDPTNENEAYARPRARKALSALTPLGIDAQTLAAVSRHLATARDALDATMAEAARRVARIELGDVLIERHGLDALPPEIARRLLLSALLWVSGAEYPPRAAALDRARATLARGKPATLHGCRLAPAGDNLRIAREPRAVAGHRVAPDALWDGRWRLTGPEAPGAELRALGQEGLRLCPARKNSPLPAASLRASPALWRGEALLSAPLAGLENGWRAEPLRRNDHDFAALLSH